MPDLPVSMHTLLLDVLLGLDGVLQDRRWHPEGDALYHSLQVYQHALRDTRDPILHAAALFHDVGKVAGPEDHADYGADLVMDLLAPDIVWLVRHHMDLHHAPRATRRALRGNPRLGQLERLRRWDVAGRDPRAHVMPPQAAIDQLLIHADVVLLNPNLHADAFDDAYDEDEAFDGDYDDASLDDADMDDAPWADADEDDDDNALRAFDDATGWDDDAPWNTPPLPIARPRTQRKPQHRSDAAESHDQEHRP